jgi:hypothetical protein
MMTDNTVRLIAHVSVMCKDNDNINCPGCMYSLGWKDAFRAMDIIKKSEAAENSSQPES